MPSSIPKTAALKTRAVTKVEVVALAASVNVFSSGTVASYGVQAQYLLGLGTSPSITGSVVEAHLSRFAGICDISGYEHVDKLTVYL